MENKPPKSKKMKSTVETIVIVPETKTIKDKKNKKIVTPPVPETKTPVPAVEPTLAEMKKSAKNSQKNMDKIKKLVSKINELM